MGSIQGDNGKVRKLSLNMKSAQFHTNLVLISDGIVCRVNGLMSFRNFNINVIYNNHFHA